MRAALAPVQTGAAEHALAVARFGAEIAQEAVPLVGDLAAVVRQGDVAAPVSESASATPSRPARWS